MLSLRRSELLKLMLMLFTPLLDEHLRLEANLDFGTNKMLILRGCRDYILRGQQRYWRMDRQCWSV